MIRAYIQQMRTGFSAPTYRLIVDGEELLRMVDSSQISMFLAENYPDAVIIRDHSKARWIETGMKVDLDQHNPNNSDFNLIYECTHCGATCKNEKADEPCKCPKGDIKLRVRKELRRAC